MSKIPLNHILLFILLLVFCPSPSFGQTSVVRSIYFKNNSSTIEKKYLETLNVIAGKLSSDSFGYLKIFGFADRRGTETYNELLSEKRALAVYKYLLARAKFDTAAVYVTWIGESEEAYDLHFPEAHIQQRCVDIWIQFSKKKKLTNDKTQNKIQTSQEIFKSIIEATNNTTRFEGRFVEIKKINEREFYLSLQDEKDSIVVFLTIMPIDDHEIRLLKKDGNNIRLNYTNFYNPVRKKTEKLVRSMTPIYEFGEK